jgi:hypothetical protein
MSSSLTAYSQITGISREQKLEIVSTIESYKSVLIELDLQQQLTTQCNELTNLYKQQIEVKDQLISNLQLQIEQYNEKEGIYETEINKQKLRSRLTLFSGVLVAVLGFLIQ